MTQSMWPFKSPSLLMYEKSGNLRWKNTQYTSHQQNDCSDTTTYENDICGLPTSSLKPMCIPQSNIMFLPPIDSRIQLRPTSAFNNIREVCLNIVLYIVKALIL